MFLGQFCYLLCILRAVSCRFGIDASLAAIVRRKISRSLSAKCSDIDAVAVRVGATLLLVDGGAVDAENGLNPTSSIPWIQQLTPKYQGDVIMFTFRCCCVVMFLFFTSRKWSDCC